MLKVLALQMLEATAPEPTPMISDSVASIHCTTCTMQTVEGMNEAPELELPAFE